MIRDPAIASQPSPEIHPSARGRPLRLLLGRGGVQLTLVLGSLVFALPFVWMVSTSLKADRQIFAFPPIWVPDPFIWGNFPAVFYLCPDAPLLLQHADNRARSRLRRNLHMLAGGLRLLAAARARARCDLHGHGQPDDGPLHRHTGAPLSTLRQGRIWIDTFYPLTVPAFLGTPFYIFMLRQFFLSIPMELEEAAIIDGASRLRIWWSIVLPLAKPALATVAIFSFMFAWNDFTGPLIFLNTREKFTLSLGLQAFMFERRTMWGPADGGVDDDDHANSDSVFSGAETFHSRDRVDWDKGVSDRADKW